MNLRWFKLYRAYSISFNSKGLYQSSGKEKKNSYFVFPSSTKRENRHFHVVVVQRRQRNAYKNTRCTCKGVIFANLNLLLFCRPRWRHRRLCLSTLSKYRLNTYRAETWRFGATFWRPKTQPTTVCTPITGRTTRASYSSRLRFNATSSRTAVPGSTSRPAPVYCRDGWINDEPLRSVR